MQLKQHRYCLSTEVDLIFLDIELPGMSGLNFLRSLRNPPLVVLTTAYGDFAVESYEFNVIDYLLKPISYERFSKAVGKLLGGRLVSHGAWQTAAPSHDHIFVKSNNKYFKVNFGEIIYIEGMKDYLKIHTADYRLVMHQTMSEMEKLLPTSRFLRVHKSYIVSIDSIRSISGNTIDTGKDGCACRQHVQRQVDGSYRQESAGSPDAVKPKKNFCFLPPYPFNVHL